MGKFISKATIASMIFSAMLSPYANADTSTYVQDGGQSTTNVLSYSTSTEAPQYVSEGKVFVDSFEQPGLYSIVKNGEVSSQDLTIVLDEGSVSYADNVDDTMYLRPVREDDGTWMQYFESNAHWISDLLSSQEFDQYESISWVGKGDSADFISELVATQPDRIHAVTLVDGGEYTSEKLTQASYDQLLHMEVNIEGGDVHDLQQVAKSYLNRGFQKVRVR
mgnify:FL=1